MSDKGDPWEEGNRHSERMRIGEASKNPRKALNCPVRALSSMNARDQLMILNLQSLYDF